MKKSLPEILKIGDVILFKSGSIVERFQRKAKFSKTASQYTHVAGVLYGHELKLIEARDFLHMSGATSLNYFIKKKVPFIVLRYFKNTQRIKRRNLAICWALQANKKYRLIELVGIYANRFIKTSFNLFGRKNGVFCSELINKGFLDVGIDLFKKPANLTYPADFYYSYLKNEFKKVYSFPK